MYIAVIKCKACGTEERTTSRQRIESKAELIKRPCPICNENKWDIKDEEIVRDPPTPTM